MGIANLTAEWQSGNLVIMDKATRTAVLTVSENGDVTVAGTLTAGAESVSGVFSHDASFANGYQLKLDGTTATATAGAATLSKQCGVVTSEALTTAAGAAYTLTLTNTLVAATSIVFATIANGTNTQGLLALGRITPGSGSVTIIVNNIHASEALNGTIVISFLVINPV